MARRLYHMAFCPLSRKIAFGLREKKLDFEEYLERTWDPSPEVRKFSPIGQLPVLWENGKIYATHQAISEYLNETLPTPDLLGNTPEHRGEVRRLCAWLEELFFQDVYMSLFYERVLKSRITRGAPLNMEDLKSGRKALHTHLTYLESLLGARTFLASNFLSWADISGSAQLSCLDYLGEIPWKNFPIALEWYVKIKSRPAFRPFLSQVFPGIPGVNHYRLLDF